MNLHSPDAYLKAPFKHIDFLERDIDLERRPDGVLVMRQRIPLKPFERSIPMFLRKWAAERPDGVWLAQRRGPKREWKTITYAEAKRIVDSLTQALIDMKLTPERPISILSGNSLEHALLTMAGMQAGIPVPRPQQASQPAGGVITPGPVMAAGQQAGQQAGQEAAQEPHIQKVRYTTNVPPGQRKTSANDILHSLAAENATGPQQGQHPVQQHGPQQAGQPAVGAALPGQPAAAGHEAAQQPQLQKVRYTTNVPPGQRKTSASEILRNSSVDAVGPNSRAGAGLAAYHAQQAGQALQAAPGQPQAPATIQPLQAPTQGQAGQPAPVLVGQSAAGESVMTATQQAVQAPQLAQPAGGYGIPPLTAMDLRR